MTCAIAFSLFLNPKDDPLVHLPNTRPISTSLVSRMAPPHPGGIPARPVASDASSFGFYHPEARRFAPGGGRGGEVVEVTGGVEVRMGKVAGVDGSEGGR